MATEKKSPYGHDDKSYQTFLDQFITILGKNAAQAFIAGDIKAHQALKIKMSFDLLNKDALTYVKKYKADLLKGGGVIDGEWVPWIEDMAKDERAAIAKIIEEGWKEGKATGNKQYKEAGKYGLYPNNTIANDLQQYFNMRKSHAATVARTEIARIQIHGTLNRYNKQGVKRVMGLTFQPCPLCEEHNRVVYDIDKIPFELPRHPACRCDWSPVPDSVPTGPAPNQPIPAVFRQPLPYTERE